MEHVITQEGGISPEAQARPIRQPYRCYKPYGLGDHPDQLELNLQWPGVPRVQDVGRVPQVDVQITGRFLIAVVEILDGRRPLAHLERRLHPRVYAALQTRVRRNPHPDQATQLRSLHTFQPADGVIEACATLEGSQRAHALAARLQRRRPGGCAPSFASYE